MSYLQQYLEKKRQNSEKVLSIYLTAGFPTPEATLPLLKAIAEAGADVIELGIPFSDPLADGPTIQASSHKALEAGTTLTTSLEILHQFKSGYSLPVLLMGYCNPFYQFGWKRLISQASSAGATGLIVPDLPPEESQQLQQQLKTAKLDLIFLVSPNTPDKRITSITHLSRGFIYAVSITGVTGARKQLPPETTFFLKRLGKQTTLPILIGFGISDSQTASYLSQLADGVIIGSALINCINKSRNIEDACKRVHQFVSNIKQAF